MVILTSLNFVVFFFFSFFLHFPFLTFVSLTVNRISNKILVLSYVELIWKYSLSVVNIK